MNVEEIHNLAHKHLNTSERQELASWLMMESSMQTSDDEYYERCAEEQERQQAQEIAEWKTCLSALRSTVAGDHR